MKTKKMKIFLISPVRKVTSEERVRLELLVAAWENQGFRVYWPLKNTDQFDPTGLRICQDNRTAMKRADTVIVAWNKSSTGSLFDLGMAFAMGKEIIILGSIGECRPTAGKSFNNMLLEWQKEGAW